MSTATHPQVPSDHATRGAFTPEEDADHDIQKLANLISDIRVAMLTTFPPGRRPHARPMYTQKVDAERFDGTLWFMTDAASVKVAELIANPEVLITYAAPTRNRFVVVTGTARSDWNPDVARELWNIHARAWFPDGPDDPHLALIRVQVMSAEYWDGPSQSSYFLNLLSSVVRGKRMEAAGRHGTLCPK